AGGHRGHAHRYGESGRRTGHGAGAVAGPRLRDQRAEFRLVAAVSRARGLPGDDHRGGDRGDRCGRHLSGKTRRAARKGPGRMTRWLLSFACMAACAASTAALVQVPEWREAREAYTFEFPRDHAAHPDYRIEWWYYTGNVDAADGRR